MERETFEDFLPSFFSPPLKERYRQELLLLLFL
jgi:hypothetical protein